MSLKTFELLDRFELLYPEVTELSDIRRAYIDKDFSSIFRLIEHSDDLRKAVIEQNLHSIFRLVGHDEDIRKAVIEQNLHSIFRLVGHDEDIRKAIVEQNIHSLFRLITNSDEVLTSIVNKNLRGYTAYAEELRKAVTENNIHSVFRILTSAQDEDDAEENKYEFVLEDLRKAVTENNLHSIFRLLAVEQEHTETCDYNYNITDLRTATCEQNLHSLFRLLEDDELRKLIAEDNTWRLWPVLNRYIDTQFVAAFKNFFANDIGIDTDCFSRGQLQSKQWLVKELEALDRDLGTVFICAGWYGTLATMLFESKATVNKIRTFDIDPSCESIAKIFNKPWVMDDWKYQASTGDIMDINYGIHTYEVTKGDGTTASLTDTPHTIINTSCEHIPNFDEWYNKLPKGILVVLQSNNYSDVEEHVNVSENLEAFAKQTPFTKELYSGELELEKYTRYMRIGIR